MARKSAWHDDYWLLLLQAYLRKPVGVKPLYNREMVDLSMELHIAPQELRARMQQIAKLQTPRLERIWKNYGNSPIRLGRAVRLLRSMKGFGDADAFYDGVEVQETFEKDFRPIGQPTADGTHFGTLNAQHAALEQVLTPAMLIVVLNLYFLLTPSTMVSETPEVQETARLLRLKSGDVVELLTVFQCCDPYLNRTDVVFSPLLVPCQEVWQRFADDPNGLATLADELRAYFKS